MKFHHRRRNLQKKLKIMIDIQLLESAKAIRKKFKDISAEIIENENELRKIADFLQLKMKELKRIQDIELIKTPTKEEAQRLTQIVLTELEDIELGERRLTKKFEKVNEQLEELKEEEEILYKAIKARYPTLSIREIRHQIENYLEE